MDALILLWNRQRETVEHSSSFTCSFLVQLTQNSGSEAPSAGSSLFGVQWWVSQSPGPALGSAVERSPGHVGSAQVQERRQMMVSKTWGEGKKPDPLQTSLLNLYLALHLSIFCSLCLCQPFWMSCSLQQLKALPWRIYVMVIGGQEGANLEVWVEYFSLSDIASDMYQLFYENQGWNTSLNGKRNKWVL